MVSCVSFLYGVTTIYPAVVVGLRLAILARVGLQLTYLSLATVGRRWANYYPYAIFASFVWIGMFSFILSTLISRWSVLMGIPTIILGATMVRHHLFGCIDVWYCYGLFGCVGVGYYDGGWICELVAGCA